MVTGCAALAHENSSVGREPLVSCSSRAWYAPITLATGRGQNATADGPVSWFWLAITAASAAGVGRAAGSLARHPARISRSAGGTPSRAASTCTTRYRTAAAVPVPNGPAPVAAYAITHPSANMSLAGPAGLPSACSGDM